WKRALRPAAVEFLHGRSPYSVDGFLNPWWILLPLAPIARLPPGWGCAVMYVLNLYAFAWTTARMRFPWFLIRPYLIFPVPILNGNNGTIDGLVALGLAVPAPIGLFLLLAKPQIGFAPALFIVNEIARQHGRRGVWRAVWPVTVAGATSLVYGVWFTRITQP